MKRLLKIACLTAITGALLSGNTLAFAGQWKQDEKGWWYQNDDGSYPFSTWKWIDGNQDGIAESYYFDENGYMLSNTTTPDGYIVDASGAWIIDNIVQTQNTSVPSTNGRMSAYNCEKVTPLALEFFNSTKQENDAKFEIETEDSHYTIYKNGYEVWYGKDGYAYRVGGNAELILNDVSDHPGSDASAEDIRDYLSAKGYLVSEPAFNLVDFKGGDFGGFWFAGWNLVTLFHPDNHWFETATE